MMPIILFIKCTFSSIEIPLRKFVNFFDKLKINRYKLNHNQILNTIVVTLFFVNVINFQTKAQITDPKKVQIDNSLQATDTIPKSDSLRVVMPVDSLGIDVADSTLGFIPADTMALDSIPPIPIGDIKTTVHYKSADSPYYRHDNKRR